MPVFDPRQGQVLFSPVTNYYRGEAIRQDAADKKQIAELRGLQIESAKEELKNAPSEREMAKRLAEANMENILSTVDERIRTGDIRELELAAKMGHPLLEAYNAEKNDDKAMAGFNKMFFESVLPSMRDKEKEKYLKMAGPDHRFDHNEIMTYGASIAGFMEKMKDPNLEIQNFRNSDGTPAGSYVVGTEAWTKAALNPNTYASGDMPASGEGKLDAKGMEIARYQELLGVDAATATKLAYGKLKIEQNPKTGRVEMLDEVTGEATELPVSNLNEIFTPKPEPGRTLWAMSDWTTGPGSAMTAAYNIPAAIMGMPVDTKVTQARQTFRTTTQSLVRALAINPKFPVAEQERIREEIKLLPALLDDPSLMRQRMISLSYDLGLRMEQEVSVANDTSVGDDQRLQAQQKATEIKNFLPIMGVPTKIKNAEDHNALPSGSEYIDPEGNIRRKK